MRAHDFGRGVMPDLVSDGVRTRLVFGRDLAGGVEVWEFPAGDPEQAILLRAWPVPARGDPALSPNGRLVAFFTTSSGPNPVQVWDIDSGILVCTTPPTKGNHPVRLRNLSVVYQTEAGVFEQALTSPLPPPVRLGPYTATGIARLTETGYVSVDVNYAAYAPLLQPAFAGPLMVGQEPGNPRDGRGGLLVRLSPDVRIGWWGRGEAWNDPAACAEAADRWAFAAWRPGVTVRVVADVTAADLASLPEWIAPTPPFTPHPVTPPRSADGRTYDLLRFVLGEPGTWPRSGPSHPMHQVSLGDGLFAFVKFAAPEAYELWAYDDAWIYHLEDASHAPYSFNDPRWYPRQMAIGEAAAFDTGLHQIVYRERGTCRELRRDPFHRRQWLHAVYDAFDWGPSLGIRATAIVAYDATGGAHGPGRAVELGYFALGAGSVRWESYRSEQVYPFPGAPARFPDEAREARSDFYLVGGPTTQPALTGCVPLVVPHCSPWTGEEPEEPTIMPEIVGVLGPAGQYLRVDPGQPDVVHFDRAGIGPHEEVEVTKEPDGTYTLKMVAADVLLCAVPDAYRFETRPSDARGAWETWRAFYLPDKSRIVAVVAHEVDGRPFVSAPLTLVRR